MRLIDADKLIKNVKALFHKNATYPSNELMENVAIAKLLDIISFQPTVNNWISVSERLPEEETQYLCVIQSFVEEIGIYYEVRRFAKDLFKVDDYDFNHKKGVSGFYYYDSEYGYTSESRVIAWMPIPTYEGE